MSGWVQLVIAFAAFGAYSIIVFLFGITFSNRFSIDIEEEVADDMP